MAGSADALKVFAAVWIAGIQSPDKPRRNNAVYVAPDFCLFEIHAATFQPHISPSELASADPPIPSAMDGVPATSDPLGSSALASLEY